MQNDMLGQFRQIAFKTFYIQLIVLLVVTLVGYAVAQNLKAGYSTLIGGMAWLLPSLFFIYKIFKPGRKIKTPLQIVKNFYFAEILKLFISAGVIIVFIKFIPVRIGWFLFGFIFVVLCSWIFPLVLMQRISRGNRSAR